MILSWLVWAEIECTVHVALLLQSINQLKSFQKSRQQAPRAYCSNVYTVDVPDELICQITTRCSQFLLKVGYLRILYNNSLEVR